MIFQRVFIVIESKVLSNNRKFCDEKRLNLFFVELG